jgi:hypothetical protein
MSSKKRSNQPAVRWTAEEDASLIKLVHEHGTSDWVLIASKLEGGRRNNQQCLTHWKAIDPSLTTGTFSAAEDASLTKLVHEHGKQWTLIASKLEGGRRNNHQCQCRWRTIDSSLTAGKFSSTEDASLTELVHEHGASAWTLIASKLAGGRRNEKQCRKRWLVIDPSLTTGKFSAVEDACLTKLVYEHGQQWTLIAFKLEGGRRSDTQCKNRWKVIDPSLSTGKFSAAEDASLIKLVHEHGTLDWVLIVSKLEGGKRNDKQCRERWKVIDPSLTKGTFSAVEDASLTKLVHDHGASAWTLIASKLEGGKRNDLQCRNRWKNLSNPNRNRLKYFGESNGKGSSSSFSTKQPASPNPPSKLEVDSDNDDDDQRNGDYNSDDDGDDCERPTSKRKISEVSGPESVENNIEGGGKRSKNPISDHLTPRLT